MISSFICKVMAEFVIFFIKQIIIASHIHNIIKNKLFTFSFLLIEQQPVLQLSL
jgi:hypothetical protein